MSKTIIKLPYNEKSFKEFELKKINKNKKLYSEVMNKNINNKNIINIDKLHLKNNICCWWCSYEFNNKPFFLPYKYIDSIYYVFGYFCSCPCVNSYNLFFINDQSVIARQNLIKKLYNNSKITLKLNKLKKYGGNLSIEEFRKINF